MAYQTPYMFSKGMMFFDTGGRFWTPEWDFEHQQGKVIIGCLTADGQRHDFESFKCIAATRRFQAENGGIFIGDEE